MIKTKFLLIIIGFVVLGSLQIWTMFDCFLQEGKPGLLSCTWTENGLSFNKEKSKLLIHSKNSTIFVYVEIADDPQERIDGLMFRENLDWNGGMFFIFDNEKTLSFWMKNTLIPLDMLFIDENFRIVDIKENALPCKGEICLSYSSKKPAKYVLEVNAGFVMKNNITINDSISFPPRI